MIIKSHIRGGYRSAAEYLKEQGQNERIRLVEISDPGANNLDEAFHNMWVVASATKCTKALHHISINPMKDERLTDKQVLAIVQRCEEKYGYKMFQHQRVIVEHVKDGRQHFHVIWNRVNLLTGRPVWPGEHWKKSKQVCREMERELGLKRPTLRRARNYGLRRQAKKKRLTNSIRKGALPKNFNSTSSQSTARNGCFTKTNSVADRFLWPENIGGSWPRHGFKGDNAQNISTRATAHIPTQTTPPEANKTAITVNYSERPCSKPTSPSRPVRVSKGWPEAAIIDWQTWGNRNPQRFFALWPELSI